MLTKLLKTTYRAIIFLYMVKHFWSSERAHKSIDDFLPGSKTKKLRIASPRCLIFSKDKPYNAAVDRDSLALCHFKFKYTVYDYTKVLVKIEKSLIFGHFAPFLKILTTVCSHETSLSHETRLKPNLFQLLWSELKSCLVRSIQNFL